MNPWKFYSHLGSGWGIANAQQVLDLDYVKGTFICDIVFHIGTKGTCLCSSTVHPPPGFHGFIHYVPNVNVDLNLSPP